MQRKEPKLRGEIDTKHKKLEEYKPGATQAQVFKALKKVAKSPKPSEKPS